MSSGAQEDPEATYDTLREDLAIIGMIRAAEEEIR